MTFQSITQLAESFWGPLQLLAFADSAVSWTPRASVTLKTPIEAFQLPAIRIAKHLLHARAPEGQGSTLGETLLENNPFEGSQRIEFLRFIAAGALGRIQVLETLTDASVRKAEGVKRRLQRWGLQYCDENVLQLVWRRP